MEIRSWKKSYQESGSCGVALLTGGSKASRGKGKGGSDEQNLRQEFVSFGEEKNTLLEKLGVNCDLEIGRECLGIHYIHNIHTIYL